MDARTAQRLRAQPFTYAEVGATAGPLPSGYRHVRVGARIGHGGDAFEVAAHRLLTWQMQERTGLTVCCPHESARRHAVLLLTLRLGPVRVVAPCRVVAVTREPRRVGMAYGTLPGHPLRGEESFVVEQTADGVVTAVVTSFSRPARWFTRLGGPAVGVLQRRAARGYVDALRRQAPD